MCLGMTAFAIDFLAHGFMDSFVGILYQAYWWVPCKIRG
jgi:type III secretory pathway component EscT